MENTNEIPQAIKDLDDVLKYVAEPLPENNGWTHINDVAFKFAAFKHRTTYELAHIIKKLNDDGYIMQLKDNENAWSITWNGRVHQTLGGYGQVYIQNRMSAVLEHRQFRINVRIKWLTWAIAAATIPAGIYATLQIIEFASTHYLCL